MNPMVDRVAAIQPVDTAAGAVGTPAIVSTLYDLMSAMQKDMRLVGTFDPLQENNHPRGAFERRALELALMGEVATDVERMDGQWYYRRSIPPQQLQAGVCALPHQFPDRAYIGLDGCTHAQGADRAGFLT